MLTASLNVILTRRKFIHVLKTSVEYHFYAPASIDWGHIVVPLSVCLLKTYPVNLHIPYADSFRQYPTSEGHIIKVKFEYQG